MTRSARPIRYRKITGTARKRIGDRMKKQYEKGASIQALAESVGRSYVFVRTVLLKAGTTLRSHGGPRRANRT
ncbi:hypothetical protein FHX81_0445 [Saccharothrix saharensis]|uniref:Helix-turn-helix domain-containing protein n=1 Tax=Saccharothrix saharensis TaxID=571190 RepID=A0A543J5S9_9PSEU|nr:helix-turn-helix domain-containing protein [Saccharothrix saharensis]TQM78189.1 hypothetical protein FHX81_0445 [Saccharothrix saharensis]